ncbi:MAG TPA: TIR-like protein FxsC [Candidatus Limnocylindrales bacterium]|nr:TIR-like protein FxsC [Candidatus Limnocylindrales bacterium]
MTSDIAVDPSAPLFFVSYAHHQWTEQKEKVRQFFEHLSMDVAELAGVRTGYYPGFIDLSLDAGERWSSELLHNLGRCQVFIALLSPNLIGSDFCGKEWDAFASRPFHPRQPLRPDQKKHQTAILPVRWVAPLDISALPKVIRDLQLFSPDRPSDIAIAEMYHDDGLLGLLNTNKEPVYRSVVWRLAQKVAAVAGSRVTEQVELRYEDLRNVFKEIP